MSSKTVIKSYTDYIEKEMKECKTEKFDKIETVGMFAIGNKVRIKVDWDKSIHKYKAKIVSFEKFGNKLFARVKWDDSYVSGRFGTLFAIDELYKG